MLSANVAQLLKASVGTDCFLEVADNIDFNKEIIGVKGKIKLTYTNRSILAQGQIEATVPAQCCRCLKEFNCPLTFKLEEEFLPLLDVYSGISLSQTENTDSFTIDANHVLDLTEALRQ
ncbi:MAG: DUF177 domain-containing protein, partial [Chloroflexi bacterium]|nr:DUF177 domain-containing protein [Chloroflexota bacterium]